MNIVFMGTPDFAVKSLEIIIEEHNVLAIVTQPDKPKGRGKKMLASPVKEKAIELGIPVLQPENAKDEEFSKILEGFNADIFVVAAYGQILTEEVIKMPRYGAINVHGSLLPKYRGAGPIQWSIINGEKTTGITIMQMAKGLDSGDMICKEEVEITLEDTYGTLNKKLAYAGGRLLVKVLKDIENGVAVKTPQDHEASTYAPMIKKETELIDWNKTSWEISCLVRGLDPQPGAYTRYKDEPLKIWQVEILDRVFLDKKCGEILEKTKKGFIVKTGDTSVLVEVMQAKGGKKMLTDAYMRGHEIELGVVLS